MYKLLVPTCLLALVAAGQEVSSGTTIRMDVNLILADATVLDNSGQLVSDLEKPAFRLLVDGVQTPITVFQKDDAPVTAGILIDNSASMVPKGPEVLAAALAFAQGSNSRDQMFVVHFSDRARLGLPAEHDFTGSIPQLKQALSAFTPSGTTALYDALDLGFCQLDKGTIPRKVLLLISDGGDNSSQKHLEDILKAAQKSSYVIYSIGIFDKADQDRNPQVLRQLAELTGGKAYFPKDLTEVTSIAAEIARDIRQQYTLGFQGQEDGQYHRISIRAQDALHGPLDVRTRSGYFATKRSQSAAQGF